MKKFFCAIFLFLIVMKGDAQKLHSLVDGLELSAMYGYDFSHSLDDLEGQSVPVTLVGTKQVFDIEQPSLVLYNHFSYGFEAKYYLKVHKQIFAGFGLAYTISRLKFDYFGAPRSAYPFVPILIFKSDELFKLGGPSLSIRFSSPESKVQVSLFRHYLVWLKGFKGKGALDAKIRRLYYFDADDKTLIDVYQFEFLPGKILSFGVIQGARLDFHPFDNPNTAVFISFSNIVSDMSVRLQHAYYEEIDGIENQKHAETLFFGGPKYRLSVGVSYFFTKNQNKKVAL